MTSVNKICVAFLLVSVSTLRYFFTPHHAFLSRNSCLFRALICEHIIQQCVPFVTQIGRSRSLHQFGFARPCIANSYLLELHVKESQTDKVRQVRRRVRLVSCAVVRGTIMRRIVRCRTGTTTRRKTATIIAASAWRVPALKESGAGFFRNRRKTFRTDFSCTIFVRTHSAQ